MRKGTKHKSVAAGVEPLREQLEQSTCKARAATTSVTMRKNAPGARTDAGWEFGVDLGERRVRCKFCNDVTTGGISRFKNHLALTNYYSRPCPNVPQDIQLKFERLLEERKRKRDEVEAMRKNAPGARTDAGWEFGVDLGERRVRCKFCNDVNTGGISRFKNHLAQTNYYSRPCPNVPQDIQLKFERLLEESKRKREKGSDNVLVDEVEDGSEIHSDRELEAFNIPMSTSSVASASTSRSADPSQNRPHIPITWPSTGTLTLDWVTNLMFTFDWSSRNLQPSELPTVFHVEVFNALVLAGSEILEKEPNCVSIEPDKDGVMGSSVVVVGDVHGQLHDVLFLLKDAGLPSENRFFVFNGDYVDRGAWGLETFVLLVAWKVLLPHSVFMLRGNHESKYCTRFYEFENEVLAKYGEEGQKVYRKCLECFRKLPLASIIAGRVYTAHGGLFRSIPATSSKGAKGKKKRKVVLNPEPAPLSLGSMEELRKARRFVLDPPYEGQNLIPADVLWSDPSMDPGLSPNEERGMGLLWGPDCTEDFLKKSSLELIIRSHEGPDAREKRPGLERMDEGYTIDHEVASGKLITVFSAPDYPQFQATEERYKNKGAYIVLKSPNFNTPVFQSFGAVLPRPKVNSYYNFEEVIDSDEELDKSLMEEASE